MRMNETNPNRLPPAASPRVIGKDFFTYSVTFLALAAATAQTGSIQIEADSDFEIIKLAQFTLQDAGGALLTASTVQIPAVTVILTDTGSGLNLMNQATPIYALFGTAERPFILPQPRTLRARSTLAIQVANVSTAVAYAQLTLSFVGSKVYKTGSGY